MKLALKSTRLGLLNSTTRLPFRYGSAALTRCPQAILQIEVEADDRLQLGYSGECLPPLWFDKSPEKDYQQQIDEMFVVISLAEAAFADEMREPVAFFPAWRAAYERVHREADERQLHPLLASFGISMVARALIDAAARAHGVGFHTLVRENLLDIEPGEVHHELAGCQLSDWIDEKPSKTMYVRHTIGLIDPLTAAEIPADERLSDGLPQSLEEYVERDGVQYFKIKVANRLSDDVSRLETIAAILQRHRGDDYHVTLDGNEQYKSADDFAQFIDAVRSRESLAQLLQNTIVIEQPLERSVALSEQHTAGIRELSRTIPVIVDESDCKLDIYPRAVELGYRGVSSKSCKGPIKSLLNAGLTWHYNERGKTSDFVLTGEDLCTVGIVSVQADLCLGATLGLTHMERNGHHYHPGLSYLPEHVQKAALKTHGDLYAEQHGMICPTIVDGKFQIGSLQCAGFGFVVEPELDTMIAREDWDYESLGF